MRKRSLHRSLMGLTYMIFFSGISAFSQVRLDTVQNYTWSFEPLFEQPIQQEAYYCDRRIDEGNHKMVKEILKKFRSRFEAWYGGKDFEILTTQILRSDVVFITRRSEYIFEIQYGNYQNSGFGLQTVGCYTHCSFDVSQGKMLPDFWMSITY